MAPAAARSPASSGYSLPKQRYSTQPSASRQSTAPAAKRYEYLQWAAQPGRIIVEDDFDSEFFRPGKPPETLWSMDEGGRVIYINTFSKSLSPSMRMGYMILPEALLPRYDEVLGRFSCTVPIVPALNVCPNANAEPAPPPDAGAGNVTAFDSIPLFSSPISGTLAGACRRMSNYVNKKSR